MVLTGIFSVFYYIVCLRKQKLYFRIKIKKTFQLFKTGFMIFINKISESILWSFDLIILTAMTATRSVGLYSMALNAIGTTEPFSQGIRIGLKSKRITVIGGKGFR